MTFKSTDSNATLNRTMLLDNTVYEVPLTPYIPPIFFLIMYERTPYTRFFSLKNDTWKNERVEEPAEKKLPNMQNTEVVLRENKLLVGEMLKSIDCSPDTIKHCFIRLEHAGSLQSMFTEAFPTPALRIGCLVRMTYKSLRKRINALDFLNDNGKSNSDLYAINYSSNNCMTTVTGYLEPLFKHALELQEAWSVSTAATVRNEFEDNGIFDVNFHLLDTVPTQRTEGGGSVETKDRPIFYVGSTKHSAAQGMRTPIKERTGRTSPLTVHDVSQFFQNACFHGDRNGAAQIQSLPVIYMRHERDFICLSASTEYNRSNVIFHIYYVWTKGVADSLNKLYTLLNSAAAAKNGNCLVRMCVCDIFESRISALLKMLDDAKTCFWKKHTNTYIRLVMASNREITSYSRFTLHSLMTQSDTSSKILLQSHIEGCRKTTTGTIEMFPNAITIDCSKLVVDLDEGVSAFAASYKQNAQDAAAYANADGAEGLPVNVLASRQQRISDMLLQFKLERIAELACNMAGEMYLGILDLYGTGEDDRKMNYNPVSNYQFLRTLVHQSVYSSSTTFDTDLHTVLKMNNVEDDKLIPSPCASFQEGIYCAGDDKEIYEFDISSAYPTIIETFNISPETTVIMHRTEFDKAEKRFENLLVSKEEGQFKLGRWWFVVPYTAPEGLVIISLIPSVYKGCMGEIFTSLVLKRRTNKNTAAYFYKRLANRLIGCMGQKGSDVFAVHCLAATSSLCQTIIKSTLNNLKDDTVKVLRTQTDGCVVQASRNEVCLSEEIRRAFSNSISALMGENAIGATKHSLLNLRIREVYACFIANQNKYAVRYADGEKVLKGHPAKFVPTISARAAVTEAVLETVDNISRAGYECTCENVITDLMDSVLKHILHYNDEVDNDFYFVERIFPLENRLEEERLLDMRHFKYDQHCRFGDSVPLWPVIKIDGDRKIRGYVHRPRRLQGPVIVDRFAILKNVINAWAFELCRSLCYNFHTDKQSRDSYVNIFYNKIKQVGDNYANEMYRIQRYGSRKITL